MYFIKNTLLSLPFVQNPLLLFGCQKVCLTISTLLSHKSSSDVLLIPNRRFLHRKSDWLSEWHLHQLYLSSSLAQGMSSKCLLNLLNLHISLKTYLPWAKLPLIAATASPGLMAVSAIWQKGDASFHNQCQCSGICSCPIPYGPKLVWSQSLPSAAAAIS